MPKFLLAYHGMPKIECKEAGLAYKSAWRGWIESLGEAVLEPALPVGASQTVHPDGRTTNDGGPNPLSGITIVQADTIEAVVEMAKTCPHVTGGGSIEVAEILDLGA